MIVLRCPACDKKLGTGRFVGWVEVFCARCKRIRKFEVGA